MMPALAAGTKPLSEPIRVS